MDLELIHGVVFARGFKRSFTGKVLLVVITHIRSSHILMLNTGYTLTDFLALNTGHIAKHALFTKVLLGQIICRQGCGMVGGQGNQMVEDPASLAASAWNVRILLSASVASSDWS